MSLHIVKKVLEKGRWVNPYEVQRILRIKYDTTLSDATITARFRDLRKEKYGKREVIKRPISGVRYYEYLLVKEQP